MRLLAYLGALAASGFPLWVDSPKSDKELIQGDWKVVSFERNGEHDEDAVGTTLRFTNGKLLIIDKEDPSDTEAEFVIGIFANENPKQIDFKHTGTDSQDSEDVMVEPREAVEGDDLEPGEDIEAGEAEPGDDIVAGFVVVDALRPVDDIVLEDGELEEGMAGEVVEAEGETLRCIYRLEGDTLILCIGEDGDRRPTVFKTEKEQECCLLHLKRVK